MPTFIDMSALTKRTTLTGNEEFQVSATEKVTAQQIADLATRGLSIITVTNFNTRTWTGGKSASEMVEGEIQAFISAANTTGAPSNSAYRGFVQKVSGNSTSYVLRYYAWSADVSVTGIYIGFSMYIGNCSWKSLTFDQSRETVIEVGDFTTINELWPASVEQTPGNVVSFYTGTDVYSQPEASETKYVGFVILDTDFANTKTATVIAYGQNTGKQYIGKLEYEAQSIDWYPLTYASRLTNAVKVTAFTESSLSSLLSSWKTGDVVPFTTNSVTASTANQFPESGIFNGFISMGSNEGDYFQIFAFKTGSPKAYIGACIGSTTQWTALGDSSEGSGPIPGYKTLVSSWSSAVTTGSTGIINFREEIPQASRILVVAKIRSSPAVSATIRANVPLTLASINNSGQGILFDLSLQYLATGTNIGSIRLICTSLITGANGVQGMNTIVQSNNLANAGDIIQLSLYYK